MKANTNTKANNKKKLIPAAGALMISAAMLGTSTLLVDTKELMD